MSQYHRIHRKASRCKNSRGTCSQACTIEGEHCEHCKLTYRACHPYSTVDPGFRQSGTAPAARHGSVTLQTIAIEAGSISGRGQGSRLQASDGSQACSARSPGAAPPLTMLARRGIHSGRRAVLDWGQAGRSSIDRPRRFWLIVRLLLLMLFSPEPSGSQPGPTATQDAPPHFTPSLGRAAL